MSALPSGIFTNIKGTKGIVDANYVRPGHYLVRINNTKIATRRPPKNDVFSAIEMTVIHVFDDEQGKGHRVGEDITHMVLKASEYFRSEIVTFIGNVMGVPSEQIGEEECVHVFTSNPLAGMVVELKSRHVTTKAQKVFTKVTYVREVPANEVLKIVPPEHVLTFFPNNVLQNIAAKAA